MVAVELGGVVHSRALVVSVEEAVVVQTIQLVILEQRILVVVVAVLVMVVSYWHKMVDLVSL